MGLPLMSPRRLRQHHPLLTLLRRLLPHHRRSLGQRTYRTDASYGENSRWVLIRQIAAPSQECRRLALARRRTVPVPDARRESVRWVAAVLAVGTTRSSTRSSIR